MIVWGGRTPGSGNSYLNTGSRYNPSGDSWISMSTGSNCPSGRSSSKAVWTGSEMIIWGGIISDCSGVYVLNTGARYNPSSNSWIAISNESPCPSGRQGSSAVWTGTELIIWGGYLREGWQYQYLNTGGRYDPLTNSWTATSLGEYCPSGRYGHSAVWTGKEMIVWGGYLRLATGGILKVAYPHIHDRPLEKP
jgi:N-acetylneuraminic acid mutarotase